VDYGLEVLFRGQDVGISFQYFGIDADGFIMKTHEVNGVDTVDIASL